MKDGGEAKNSDSSSKDGGVLYLRVNAKTNRQETNFPDWQRYWEEVRIGRFGSDFKKQLDTREWRPFNLAERLAEFPPQIELNTDRDYFVPSDEQQALLDALVGAERQARQLKIFCNQWQEERRESNTIIKAANECQKTLRDVVAKDFADYPDKVTMIFADINASMTEISRLKVQAYKRGSPGTANYMDYDTAVAQQNWLWMYEAAEATHLMRGAEKDAVVLLERQQAECAELRAFHQGHQEFTFWLRRFEDKMRTVEAVGYELSDLEKRVALVNSLNSEVFDDLKRTWGNLSLRAQLPANYDALKDLIITTYSTVDQAVIARARRGEKTESSFASRERRDGGGNRTGCYICGASEKDFHRWATCPHYNPKFTVEQNAAYFARKAPAQQKTGGEQTEKVEVQNVCTYLNLGEDHEDARSLLGQTLHQEKSCVTLATEHSLQAGVRAHEIDFVLDTATETGASNSKGRELLEDLQTEHAALIGVGGHRVHVKEVGINLFGRSRVVDNRGAYNLVSQAECKTDWQIVNPSEDHIFLQGWEGKGKEHLRWDFYRNEERYKDKLLHCTLPKQNFRVFMSTFHAMTLYKPEDQPDNSTLTQEERESIEYVEGVHLDLAHASPQALIRTVAAELVNDVPYHMRMGISVADIELWAKHRGKWCAGCILGKMTEHNRSSSTKVQASEVGEDGAADLLFVEQAVGGKRAVYTHTDIGSKCRFLVDMQGKTEQDIKDAVRVVSGYHEMYGHKLKTLSFDRESAVVRIQNWLVEALHIRTKLKASNQKVGLAEIDIRLLKDGARATKSGVREQFGYNAPPQWNQDLCHHVNSCQNALVRTGMSKSPAELFTGRTLDGVRDLRGLHWGQPVLAKRPNVEGASDLREKAQWVVPVRCYRDGSGLVKVYVVETKKYAHRFKFAHAKPPARIMQLLSQISPSEQIGFEDEQQHGEQRGAADIDYDDVAIIDEEGFVERIEDTGGAESAVDQATLAEMYRQDVGEPMEPNPAYEQDIGEWGEHLHVSDQQEGGEQAERVGRYPVRERKPKRLEDYVYNITKCNAITYEKALKLRPESATQALNVELDNIDRKEVWHGVHEEDLSIEERGLIIDTMKNFKSKYLPTGEHEKDKVRVLARGDKQREDMLGETHGPVSRVESIFLLASIAALKEYEVVKIDFVAAYLNTKMPPEVRHRWLLLDRSVSNLLCERNPEYWLKFCRADGRVLVEMDKLLYGYKEAAHYWWETLQAMFVNAGYVKCGSDECVLTLRDGDSVTHVATTVDDCFFITSDTTAKEKLICMCRDTFKEITVEEGDSLNIIGMNFNFDRVSKTVKVQQRQYIKDLIEKLEVKKSVPTPALLNLYDVDAESPLLHDQLKFMSINSSCMYAGKRTYPEILPATTYLASKYWRATEEDLVKVMRIVEYLNHDIDDHCLRLHPSSMTVTASSDASYAEHSDGRSQTGGCVGLDGEGRGSFFIFVSSKQPMVAKSSCEAELISGSTVGDYVLWLLYMIEQLGYG